MEFKEVIGFNSLYRLGKVRFGRVSSREVGYLI